MDKFCENQIRCKEDIEKGTWTCCAHLASEYCFQCNCLPTGITNHRFINYNGEMITHKIMIRPNGERCIDWEPVKEKPFISESEFKV